MFTDHHHSHSHDRELGKLHSQIAPDHPIVSIVEITMVPSSFKDFSSLEHRLKSLLSNFEGLSNINYDDVIVSILRNVHTPNTGRFVYVKVWMHKCDHRPKALIDRLRNAIGNTVFECLVREVPEVEMIEVLPIEMMDPQGCFVKNKVG